MPKRYEWSTDVLAIWTKAVNAKQLDAILDLYGSDAVLQPTFSNRFLRGREGLNWYFTQLSERDGLEVVIHEKTITTQTVGDIEVLSGIYRWGYEINGAPLKFEARFTFVMDLTQEAPILHHHSSQLPRTLD